MHKIYKMRKSIFILLVALISIHANSQDLLEKVTKEVCTCIEAKKESLSDISSEKLKVQLGLCILSSYSAHEKEINSKYGKIMEDEKAMDKFGEEVGMKMITVCPETLMAIAGAVGDEDTKAAVEEEKLSVEGKITEIKNEQFTSVVVKDKNARLYTFLVLNYFETASLITGNEIKKEDNVVVYYSDIELYDNKTKEFRFFKVISGIEKK